MAAGGKGVHVLPAHDPLVYVGRNIAGGRQRRPLAAVGRRQQQRHAREHCMHSIARKSLHLHVQCGKSMCCMRHSWSTASAGCAQKDTAPANIARPNDHQKAWNRRGASSAREVEGSSSSSRSCTAALMISACPARTYPSRGPHAGSAGLFANMQTCQMCSLHG